MGEYTKLLRKFEFLKRELNLKARYYRLTSPEVVQVSQQMDKHIVKIMKSKINNNLKE